MNSILLLGDAHLRDRDPELEAFLRFLKGIPDPPSILVILGDLFDLWVGSPAFVSDCHRRVVDSLMALKDGGMESVYVEGNRDYRLKSLYRGRPFQAVWENGGDLTFGARRIHVTHGDCINRDDRPYRLWRKVAKGPWLLGAFERLPRRMATALTQRLEKGIAKTNRRHRIAFPEAQCRRFALDQRKRGLDTLVVGHFHKEMRLVFGEGSETIEVYVLPSWREGRRFLRIREDGTARFEEFREAGMAS